MISYIDKKLFHAEWKNEKVLFIKRYERGSTHHKNTSRIFQDVEKTWRMDEI